MKTASTIGSLRDRGARIEAQANALDQELAPRWDDFRGRLNEYGLTTEAAILGEWNHPDPTHQQNARAAISAVLDEVFTKEQIARNRSIQKQRQEFQDEAFPVAVDVKGRLFRQHGDLVSQFNDTEMEARVDRIAADAALDGDDGVGQLAAERCGDLAGDDKRWQPAFDYVNSLRPPPDPLAGKSIAELEQLLPNAAGGISRTSTEGVLAQVELTAEGESEREQIARMTREIEAIDSGSNRRGSTEGLVTVYPHDRNRRR